MEKKKGSSVMMQTAKKIFAKKKDHGFYQLHSAYEASLWNEYPRPQMKRDKWQCLNGIWIIHRGEEKKSIRVPFPPQADLSGYETPSVSEIPEELLYERDFVIEDGLKRKKTDRILLHIGAADQIAEVFINGKPAAHHEGGYLPFTCDITDYLHPEGETNRLSILCIDHLDHKYPWGKQRKDRGGMWYTPVTGIWQTVWLEAVPEKYIENLKIETVNNRKVNVKLKLAGFQKQEIPGIKLFLDINKNEKENVNLNIKTDNKQTNENCTGQENRKIKKTSGPYPEGTAVILSFEIQEPHLWSPEDPYLYHLEINAGEDRIASYFAFRTVSIEEVHGMRQICLNGRPVFFCGLLDQGYYCDGLFLPADPVCYEEEIRNLKALGFNMLRKHIKVEPELFYYACDRLGMLVMQDMVNNGPYAFVPDTGLPTIGFKKHIERSYDGGSRKEKERKAFFLKHSMEMQDHLFNHPSVIAYTVFNEGWGQFASDRVGDLLRAHDPGRIYDYTSGWFTHKNSQVESIHEYFNPRILTQQEKPLLLSECGGCTWKIDDHSYCANDNYGYGQASSREELMEKIRSLYETMIYPSIPKGLCGFIYTQVSDVEDEVNGIYTYDRAICKPDPREMAVLNKKAQEIHAQSMGITSAEEN